jgi:MSHA biogenesis protein MshM
MVSDRRVGTRRWRSKWSDRAERERTHSLQEGGGTVWRRHWGLTTDPFLANGSTYVPLASHEEAVARLVYAIESRQPRATLLAEGGMGKTTVLRRVLAQTSEMRRQIVLVDQPRDELLLLTRLSERLGQGSLARRAVDRSAAWRLLDRAVRLLAIQGISLVIAIDNCQNTSDESMSRTLRSLPLLGRSDGATLTVIPAGDAGSDWLTEEGDDWPPVARIDALTRTETERYLTTKLAWAGCTDPVFTARAVTRLHALSEGVPRTLERLAALCLMAGALRGMEVVTPELADGVAPELAAGGGLDFRRQFV